MESQFLNITDDVFNKNTSEKFSDLFFKPETFQF